MNKVYRIIWNKTLQRFDVVSELARSQGKSTVVNESELPTVAKCGWKTPLRYLSLCCLAALSLWLPLSASAALKYVQSDDHTIEVYRNTDGTFYALEANGDKRPISSQSVWALLLDDNGKLIASSSAEHAQIQSLLSTDGSSSPTSEASYATRHQLYAGENSVAGGFNVIGTETNNNAAFGQNITIKEGQKNNILGQDIAVEGGVGNTVVGQNIYLKDGHNNTVLGNSANVGIDRDRQATTPVMSAVAVGANTGV
ncbi:hypothetical protein FHQ26_06675 [Testudinibacter sp. TR-2022]|nr:ESPR domain-containing protein [Testudinibacter sp. TR-2022]TNH01558.1 hypothetical protein FHQ22_11220 [Pasteurellaceae bacterium Phil31]TNH09733.1 hypothetical protein FHQ26_06675 [Testudinibacter sp. TR-2022]TNH11114.1 hypothetical protein FHQ25_03645 [Testudinibacter sp. TR-2022]